MKRICVFMGSSPGKGDVYRTAAQELAHAMAERELDLVYGGGRVGLMGTLADAVLAAGRQVVGVIPKQLATKELAHSHITELRIVGSMHERKAMMAELSDGFIAMPGGLGTLDEFCEILTWAQLGLHRKPCGVLNVNGFFDSFLAHLDHAVEERFLPSEHKRFWVVSSEAGRLLDLMSHQQSPAVEKWLDREGT